MREGFVALATGRRGRRVMTPERAFWLALSLARSEPRDSCHTLAVLGRSFGAAAVTMVLVISVQQGAPASSGSASESHGYRVALDASSGRRLWRARFGGPEYTSCLAFANSGVVFGTASGTPASPIRAQAVDAFNERDGRLRWRQTLTANRSQPLKLVGGPDPTADQLVIAAWRGSAVALQVSDGRERWHARATQTVAAGPNYVYVVAQTSRAGQELQALERRTGRVRWRAKLPGPVTFGLLTASTLALVGPANAPVVVMDALTGEHRFSVTVGRGEGAVLTDSALIYDDPAAEGVAVAVDAHTGTQLWKGRYAANRSAPVLGDVVYLYDLGGASRLSRLQSTTGSVDWTMSYGQGGLLGAAPTRTTLLIGNSASSLVAVDAASGSVRWATNLPGFTSSAALDGDRVFASSGCGED
jgi:outer membrane protein assembly factor BamB